MCKRSHGPFGLAARLKSGLLSKVSRQDERSLKIEIFLEGCPRLGPIGQDGKRIVVNDLCFLRKQKVFYKNSGTKAEYKT